MEQKTSEKSMKLKEANRQRTFIAAVKDLDFWLGEVSSNVFLGLRDRSMGCKLHSYTEIV